MGKRNFIKNFIAMAAATAMVALQMVMPASAAAPNVPVAGGTTLFNKYLILNQDAEVPSVSFSYSIANGEHKAASGTAPEILSGSAAAGTPTFTDTAEFTSASTSYSTVQTGDTLTLATGEKYAKDAVTVSFEAVTFPYPGIYRYVVTENTTPAQAGISYNTDSITTRYLDVYVQDTAGDGHLSIQGYVLHNTTDASNSADGYIKQRKTDANSKDGGFQNSYDTKNLTVMKTVSGNQGDRGEYFPFTVTITGANPSTKYNTDITNAEATVTAKADTGVTESKNNVTTFTSDANGSATVIYYLKAGQSVVIKGIPITASYQVAEGVLASEGYTTTYAIVNTDTQASIAAATAGVATGSRTIETTAGDKTTAVNQKVTFNNDRQGTVPTGIFMDMAPFLVMTAAAVVALAFFLIGRKNRKDRRES